MHEILAPCHFLRKTKNVANLRLNSTQLFIGYISIYICKATEPHEQDHGKITHIRIREEEKELRITK